MSNLSNQNVVYMIQNLLTGEFLSELRTVSFGPTVWDGQHFGSREAAKKARTQVRTALAGDVPSAAIDLVRVRADVRRGTRGRPRKIEA